MRIIITLDFVAAVFFYKLKDDLLFGDECCRCKIISERETVETHGNYSLRKFSRAIIIIGKRGTINLARGENSI